jgi:hypothetical protein
MNWIQKPSNGLITRTTNLTKTAGYCKIDLCPLCIIKICWKKFS